MPANTADRDARVDAALAEYLAAAGRAFDRRAWLARYADVAAELAEFLDDQALFEGAVSPLLVPTPGPLTTPPIAPDARTRTFAGDGTISDPAGLPGGGRFGDYELLDEVARGGMGVVYQARQVSLNRVVALKMIAPDRLEGRAERDAFRREAEAAAALDHPNIVPIYEVGEAGGRSYFTMKLVEGGSLAQHLAQSPRPTGRGLVTLLAQVARAVHYAHQRGILHRDLKPSNILLQKSEVRGQKSEVSDPQSERPTDLCPLTSDLCAQVADFGLAKRLDGPADASKSGVIVGTPAYMAPEQARGERGLTTAADVYGLGAILYEALAGRPPFRGPSPAETLVLVLTGEVARPRALDPTVPPDLEAICLKCLARDPAARYGSAEALADDLDRWARGEPVRARSVTRSERAIKWVRRHPSRAAAIGLGGVAVLALVGLAVGLGYGSRLATAKAEVEESNARLEDANSQLGQANDRLQSAVRRADDLRTVAEALRGRAEGNELAAQRLLYAYEFRRADEIGRAGRFAEARAALDRLRPAGPEARDFRGFEWHYADRLAAGGQPLGDLDDLAADAVAFSPDGREVATEVNGNNSKGQREKVFRLHRADTGVRTGTMRVPDPWFPNPWLPDPWLRLHAVAAGRVLVVNPEGEAWVGWGTPKRAGPRGYAVVRAALSANGRRVCAVCQTGGKTRLVLWEPDPETVVFDVALDGGSVNLPAPVFAPDGQSVFWDRRLWDTAGKPRAELAADIGPVRCAAFHPTKPLLAISRESGGVMVMSVPMLRSTVELRSLPASASALAFRPDGRELAIGFPDGSVAVADAETWHLVSAGHLRLPAAVTALAFNPDTGALVATDGRQVRARRAAAADGLVIPNDGQPTQLTPLLAFSPDGRSVASGFDKTVKVWDARTGKVTWSWESAADRVIVYEVAFSPDGKYLAAALSQDMCRVWDLTTGAQVHHLKSPAKVAGNNPALRVAVSKDSRLLAVGFNQSLEVFDLATGAPVRTIRGGPGGRCLALDFAPDRPDLLAVHTNGVVNRWDGVTGTEIFSFRPHPKSKGSGRICSVRFFKDGRRFLTGADDHTVKLWDGPGAEVRTFRGHTGEVFTAALSPDERRLATASQDGTVRVWDVESGTELLVLRGHRWAVYGVAFSPDGTRLASVGQDRTIRIWDATPMAPAEEVGRRP